MNGNATTDSATETAAVTTPGWWRKLVEGIGWRNIIAIVIIVLVVGPLVRWRYSWDKPDVAIDCTALHESQRESSRATLVAEILGVQERRGLEQESLDAAISELEATANPSPDDVAQLRANEQRLEEIQAELEALAEALENTSSSALDGVGDRTFGLEDPGSPISLEVRSPESALVEFGSSRKPKRVQIVVEPIRATSDGETQQVDTAATGTLPLVPEFRVEIRQFARGNNLEIPPNALQAWAVRQGNQIVVDLCITPSADRASPVEDGDAGKSEGQSFGMDPGRYKGTVVITDSRFTPLVIPVEVTAQWHQMTDLAALLIFSPIAAVLFVYLKLRHSAAQTWSWPNLRWWLAHNLALALIVGFAATYATIRVAFTSPTWGESVVESAAVVGATLVAAVGAITTLAGPVVEEE